MPGVVRQGDTDTGGGAALTGVDSVLVNGRPIVTIGTPVSRHGKKWPHTGPTTAGGVSSVLAGNKPVIVQGNPDTCGHTRASASSDVIAG
jgi:uncharacterized Zn-binding protein involved in type VI secretion